MIDDDPRIRAACDYVLDHAQSMGGGFGFSGSGLARPASSSVVHCLNGNLLRALIGFGQLDDARVQRSLAYQASSITGEGDVGFYKSATAGVRLPLRHELRRSLRLGSHEGRPGPGSRAG
jgi:hypothetical protein